MSRYRRRFDSPGMDRDEYRRRYSPMIPHTRDEYRRSQSPARHRRSFQSPSSTDRNGRSKPFDEEVVHLLRKMDTRLGNEESRLDDLTTRMERVEPVRRSPSPRRNPSDLRCHGCGKQGQNSIHNPPWPL